MRKNKDSDPPEDAGSWMNTYSDLVTLLFCFFVLLYSMSSVDSAKWEILVKSFNPNADEISQIVENMEANNADNDFAGKIKKQDEVKTDFDELYYQLSQFVEDNNMQSSVEVTKGEDYTFIMFSNSVFFDGDSSVLKDEGKVVLDEVSNSFLSVKDDVSEVRILGHTSQATPEVPNEIVSDRYLSSDRATEVLLYIQRKNIFDPAVLVSSGYGQFRPIAPFDTSENRAKNRRVEILITKKDATALTLEEYYDAVYKNKAD